MFYYYKILEPILFIYQIKLNINLYVFCNYIYVATKRMGGLTRKAKDLQLQPLDGKLVITFIRQTLEILTHFTRDILLLSPKHYNHESINYSIIYRLIHN